jgi:hypothetical protein
VQQNLGSPLATERKKTSLPQCWHFIAASARDQGCLPALGSA